MKTLPIDDHNQGIFSHKLGHFFPIFEKGQGGPFPSPRPVTLREAKEQVTSKLRILLIRTIFHFKSS